MQKNTKKLKETLKKLKVLAERGVGGEKETAQRKLEKLMKQSGLTERDLKDEEVKYYLFNYHFPHKKRLMYQLIYKTLGVDNFKLYHSKNTRNKVGAYCTPAQKLEIELDFDFYSALLDDEIETLMTAFIAKQDLYPENAPTVTRNEDEMTEEELKEWKKISMLKDSISKRKRSAGMLEDKESK